MRNNKMEKYVIDLRTGKRNNTAQYKAKNDIASVLEKNGYRCLPYYFYNAKIQKVLSVIKLIHQINEIKSGILIYQFPLGRREDVPSLMSLFDCMIFPSLYEGFPLTLVEAQSVGLPIVCSDSISSNIKILLTTHQLSLKKDKKAWANLAIKSSEITDTQRELARKKLLMQAMIIKPKSKK